MKIACLAFTRLGEAVAQRLQAHLPEQVDCFFRDNYREQLDRVFRDYDAVIFISATGIAVRLAAPYLTSKSTDPAIVVVDDMAMFAISLVSGHIGGANDLARRVATLLKCQPVITTASDNRGVEAVDVFAERCGLVIENMVDARTITAMMVDGRKIGFRSVYTPRIDYPQLTDQQPDGVIVVDIADDISREIPCCVLRPRVLTVGLGFRRGKSGAEIRNAISMVFAENKLALKSIRRIATIELKQDEPGLHQAVAALGCELVIYSAEDLKAVQKHFAQSELVLATTGVGAISEPCAFLGGNRLIVNRTIIDGITVAVSEPERND